jgi:hypothetical protein
MMNPLSLPRRPRARREEYRAQRDARNALARELAAFDSPRDLVDLSAMLERYDDVDVAEIRRLVRWTPAA